MKPTKPIYSVKKLNGQTVVEGDFDTIQAWLAEGRISSDDDLRREGVHVYEGDELWGRVKDFPEFNLNDREGRQALKRARSQTIWISVAAGIALLAGVSLLVYNQWLPRYTEPKRLADAITALENTKKSEFLATQRADELESKQNVKFKELEDAKMSAIKEVSDKSREEIAQLNNHISKLNESHALYKNKLIQVTAANEKLSSVKDENEQLNNKLAAKSEEVVQLIRTKDEVDQLKNKLAVKSEEIVQLLQSNDRLKLENYQMEITHVKEHHPERLNSK